VKQQYFCKAIRKLRKQNRCKSSSAFCTYLQIYYIYACMCVCVCTYIYMPYVTCESSTVANPIAPFTCMYRCIIYIHVYVCVCIHMYSYARRKLQKQNRCKFIRACCMYVQMYYIYTCMYVYVYTYTFQSKMIRVKRASRKADRLFRMK